MTTEYFLITQRSTLSVFCLFLFFVFFFYVHSFSFFSADASDYIVKDAQSEELYDMELRTSLQRARACPLLKVCIP